MGDRSVHVQAGSYTPGKSLTLVKNPYWDPNTDPGRHQYVDEFDFDFDTDQREDRPDHAGRTPGSGQTTISYDNVLADDYRKFAQTRR